MPSGRGDRKSDRHGSGKPESDKSRFSKATEWSDWQWDENGARWYQSRIDEYGELEYNIHGYASVHSNTPGKGYNTNEDCRFGAPPNSAACNCGPGGCSPNSGCVKSTKYGEPEQEKRQPDRSRDNWNPHSPTSFSHKRPQPNAIANSTYPLPIPTYQANYIEDDYDQQPEHSVTSSAPYVATPYSSSAINGRQSNDNKSNQSINTYTTQVSPSTTSATLQTFQNLSLQQDAAYGADTAEDGFQGHLSEVIMALPLDSDHGAVFGRICNEMGLLKENRDYWDYPERYEQPASYWNGERLQNNCVFVSVGYLLGMRAEDLSAHLLAKPLPTQLQGINIGDIERILYRIPGLNIVAFPNQLQDFRRRRSHSSKHQQLFVVEQQRFALDILRQYLNENQTFAVGYRRVSGSGHCVVAQKMHGQAGNSVEDYQFTCYQHETDGRDMSDDVRKSFISFAILISPESGNRGLERCYESTLQSDGTRIAPHADHVTFHNDGSSPTMASYTIGASTTVPGDNYAEYSAFNPSPTARNRIERSRKHR